MTDRELMSMAKKASLNAYVPYSRFPVGAALECDDGTVFTGCNVENAAFGSTICAERTAIGNAVSAGAREFLKIAIAGGKNGEITDYCPPCGICRQVLSEFCGEDFEILLYNGENFKNYRLSELLPFGFGREEVC